MWMPARRTMYGLATSDRLERAVRAVPPLERACYRRARRYVAGTTLDEALAVAARLQDQGLSASIDRFGEGVDDPDAVRATVDCYIEAASRLRDLASDADLEVVPSNLGLGISPAHARRQLEQILEVLPAGSRLQVSAEESWRTAETLEIALALAREGAPLAVTLQANLKRSEADAERLAEAGAAVRLVKGAYLEPGDIAHPWGEATDLAFLGLARKLHAAGAALAIGTHDPVILEALLGSLDGIGVEMLYGVREHDARELVRRGVRVRIYVPFGDRWFRYWMRRVAETAGRTKEAA